MSIRGGRAVLARWLLIFILILQRLLLAAASLAIAAECSSTFVLLSNDTSLLLIESRRRSQHGHSFSTKPIKCWTAKVLLCAGFPQIWILLSQLLQTLVHQRLLSIQLLTGSDLSNIGLRSLRLATPPHRHSITIFMWRRVTIWTLVRALVVCEFGRGSWLSRAIAPHWLNVQRAHTDRVLHTQNATETSSRCRCRHLNANTTVIHRRLTLVKLLLVFNLLTLAGN